jgi:UDP-N-acetyl-D-glucosamine dehydrogenase
MPHYVLQKTTDALNDRGKPVKGSRILVLGIAYKKNVDDMRESPSVEIMKLLQQKGALIEYSDPLFPTFPAMRQHSFTLSSVELSSQVLALYDACILATDHDLFDYKMIWAHAALVIDTRGRLQPSSHVIRA